MEERKRRVLITAGAALLLLVLGGIYQTVRSPQSVVLKTAGYPSIGSPSAKVEVVLFEDFRCSHCRIFSEKIFPQIRERYIESGQVRYTVVPLAFLNGSKPMANSAIEVYYQAPSRFFPYVHELFLHSQREPMNERALLDIAGRVGGIDLMRLHACIASRCHYDQLEKNLEWAHSVMGRDFATPALYVNGIPTSTSSFRPVRDRIEQVLAKKRR